MENIYISNRIIKEINKVYFSSYKDTEFTLVKSTDDIEKIKLLSKIAENLSTELKYLCEDLILVKQKCNDIKYFKSATGKVGFSLFNLLSLRCKDNLPQDSIFKEVTSTLISIGNSCLIGGAVRDTLLGLEPKDWDFVTDADYGLITKTFSNLGYKVMENGKHFLVLSITKEGKTFEIACYRKDNTYEDGRRPTSVEIGTLETDAFRRDFSINSIYFSLNDSILIDPSGLGIGDILTRTLRFIGSPKDRIAEDYLRVYRFFRLLSTKRLNADSNSLKTCRAMFSEATKKTDPERIRIEVERMIPIL